MGDIILKATKDDDLYCLWSTVAESPWMIGTRVEIADELLADTLILHERGRRSDREWEDEQRRVEDRLKRADEMGTSSHISRDGWNTNHIFEQKGFLPHSKLKAFLESVKGEDGEPWEFDVTMLEPFDDE